MTLTELRYIVAVAKAKHFGKAAEDCCVSQPTLSVGIRKLEDSLGVTIFERGRSEVKLTPIGKSIINQAKNVLSEAQVIRDIAESEKDQLKNPIKIASTYTIGKYLFPHLIKQAYNISPRLSLLLNQDYSDVLLEKLMREELDVLILTSINNNSNNNSDNSFQPHSDLAAEISSEISSETVLSENLYLLASSTNKYAELPSLSVNNLVLSDLLLLNKRHCLHQQVLSLKPDWNGEPERSNEYNFDSLEALYHIVKDRCGATIVPASFSRDISNTDTDIKVLNFSEPAPRRSISLVWRKDFPRLQVVETLKESLRNIDMAGLEAV